MENTPPIGVINKSSGISNHHWSETITWRDGRWDPMSNAPVTGRKILHVRGRTADGKLVEPMHFACGGGEEQPPFKGWFVPYDINNNTQGFYEVLPVEWQPLQANPLETEGY